MSADPTATLAFLGLVGLGYIIVLSQLKIWKRESSLTSKYMLIEETALDKLAKKLGLDTKVYETENEIKESKGFRERLEEKLISEHFEEKN